jgi:hypothetical protein
LLRFLYFIRPHLDHRKRQGVLKYIRRP